MELSGRPLFDNPLDAALFVPREEADRVERNCRDGVNTLLFGGRGMGKTSLIRNVLFRLREAGFPAVGVDAASADDAFELLRLVRAALGQVRIQVPGVDLLAAAGMGGTAAVMRELRELDREELKTEPRTAILIDLPPGNTGLHQLFGRFRDELWQLPYTWVVAAPTELRVELMTPPADAFFEDVVQLDPLTAAQQEKLIELRLDEGERTPWRLPAEGEGNPRQLLSVVRESIRSGESPRERSLALARRETEVASLGRSASMLYAELQNYGPASASDEELLERLGWSRQRAAKVFAELEREGFVSSEMRQSKRGRPRKVFLVEGREGV